jgi:aconitate hydratase 2/2-methylisocitrate dehydratase
VHGQPGADPRRLHRDVDLDPQLPEPLGRNTNVYLGSAELAAICSRLGRIPTKEEYMADVGVIAASGAEIYRYMNFDQIEEYQDVAKTVAA